MASSERVQTVIIIRYIHPGYGLDEGISIMVILDQQTRSERQTGCSEQHTNHCNGAEVVQQVFKSVIEWICWLGIVRLLLLGGASITYVDFSACEICSSLLPGWSPSDACGTKRVVQNLGPALAPGPEETCP
jgi:hypothetical protein